MGAEFGPHLIQFAQNLVICGIQLWHPIQHASMLLGR